MLWEKYFFPKQFGVFNNSFLNIIIFHDSFHINFSGTGIQNKMTIISFCNKELQLNLIKVQMNKDMLLSFNSKHCFDNSGGLSKMSCPVVLFSKIFKHLISIIPCSLFWSLCIKPFGLAARWMYFSLTQSPPLNFFPSVTHV